MKGRVEPFDPDAVASVSFVEVDDPGRAGEPRDIPIERIRAAFFVHDLAPYRRYRLPERPAPSEAQVHPLNGEVRLRLELEWGERLDGLVRSIGEEARWFQFVPVGSDRAGNLIHALIAADAIVEAEPLEPE